MMPKRAPKRFWAEFEKVAESVSALLGDEPARAVETVDELLKESGFDIAFDLTEEGSSSVLVFSPEDATAEAEIIDELVDVAPEIPGWKIYGRRQKKPIEDAVAITREIFGIDLAESRLHVIPGATGLKVILFSTSLNGMDPETSNRAVLTLLNHAAGEQTVMDLIEEVAGSEDMPASDELMTLKQVVDLFEESRTS